MLDAVLPSLSDSVDLPNLPNLSDLPNLISLPNLTVLLCFFEHLDYVASVGVDQVFDSRCRDGLQCPPHRLL